MKIFITSCYKQQKERKMNEQFLQALPILKKIEKNGFEAVYVGGCVRDALLNRPIHDVDIATSATPEEIKAIFPKTVDVGIEHGTVMVLENGDSYEVTTYRAESEYVDFRKPKEVKFIRSLRDDLERRDFTMNAIAMNTNGDLIDPFDGQRALREREIVTVGSADERFHEDALRMMRAVRFVSQLSFSCTPETLSSLKTHKALLKQISIERITVEFEKMLDGKNVQAAISLLTESELFLYLPGLADKKDQLRSLSEFDLAQLKNVNEKWAVVMLRTTAVDEIETVLRQWRLSVKRIREIIGIVRAVLDLPEKENDRMRLFTNGLECCVSACRIWSIIHHLENNEHTVSKLKQLWNSLVIHDYSELAITGHQLIEWSDRAKGPWISETLRIVTEKVLNGEIENDIESIRVGVEQWNLI